MEFLSDFSRWKLSFAVDDYDTHFDQTIETLPLLAKINEIHSQKMQDMKMTTPDFRLPALHEEVFDSG